MFARRYRYAVLIHGASYAPPDINEPTHVIMAMSLDDVRQVLHDAAGPRRNPGSVYGDGTPTLDTPGYGDEGDGAYIYKLPYATITGQVGYEHLIEDLDGDPYPDYTAEFTARGLRILPA